MFIFLFFFILICYCYSCIFYIIEAMDPFYYMNQRLFYKIYILNKLDSEMRD